MLDETQIKAILNTELDDALGYLGSELSTDRANAMDYYLGEPTGKLKPPAGEDRSRVVDSTVRDVIEWILPQLLKTFTQSNDYVRFDPENPEDEELAEQESDYVNYVLTKQNDGFLIFYSMFKDALLEKTGISKIYWDETTKVSTEEYQNLNEFELAQLLQDEEVEPVEHEEVITDLGVLHNVTIKRTCLKGQCIVDPVPPEEFLINADHNSPLVDKARFVAHETIKTASELREMGISKDVIKNLPAYDHDFDDEERNSSIDEDFSDEAADQANKKIRLYDIYCLIDQDEDGIAERRHILYVKNSEILENDECDHVPFACITPFIQTHRFIGQSIYDKCHDIQEQKTFIWRQINDNLALQNNQRFEVDYQKVNLDDMLTNRPGGVIRTKQIGSIAPIVTPPLGAAGYQMLEYLDKTREERTGVGKDTMGQQINLSNDTAHGIERMMTAKEELVGLIARVFGETGIKRMFLLVRELLMKHQDKQAVVKLRGKWVNVNPSDWKDRTSMTLKVGLGTGDRLKQVGVLQAVVARQDALLQSPFGQRLLTAKEVYKAHVDFAEAGGLADGEVYFADPELQPPAPPPIDPMMVQQMQQQMQAMGQQIQQYQVLLQNKEREQQLRAEELKLKERERIHSERVDVNKLTDADRDATHKERLEMTKLENERMRLEADIKERTMMLAQKEQELALREREIDLKYVEPIELAKADVTGQLQPLIDTMANIMRQMTAPKRVLRDESGRAIGVETILDS